MVRSALRALGVAGVCVIALLPVLLTGCKGAETRLTAEEEAAMQGRFPPGGMPEEARREIERRLGQAAEAKQRDAGQRGGPPPAAAGPPPPAAGQPGQ